MKTANGLPATVIFSLLKGRSLLTGERQNN